jgi:hypothetical protein
LETDGSHYIPYDAFLRMDAAFWLGSGGQSVNAEVAEPV